MLGLFGLLEFLGLLVKLSLLACLLMRNFECVLLLFVLSKPKKQPNKPMTCITRITLIIPTPLITTGKSVCRQLQLW